MVINSLITTSVLVIKSLITTSVFCSWLWWYCPSWWCTPRQTNLTILRNEQRNKYNIQYWIYIFCSYIIYNIMSRIRINIFWDNWLHLKFLSVFSFNINFLTHWYNNNSWSHVMIVYLKGIQPVALIFFTLKVANIRCFMLITAETFHNIIRK